MPPDPATEKVTARRAARAAIRAIPPTDRSLHSTTIRQILAETIPHHPTVLAFAPLPLEPDLLPLIATFPHIRFAFPLVTGPGTLTLHHVTSPSHLTSSNSPIPEPDPTRSPAIPIQEISLALVPALAFDPATGLRLGHGGGFYDRLLASPEFTAQTIGIAFSCQLTIPFPTEPHDQPVSAIVTEHGLNTPQTN